MFIAMNRFKVLPGAEADFEAVWLNRESHLHKVPGFVEFHMLRGPQRDDHRLYIRVPVGTSRCIWGIRSSRASKSSRR